MSTEVTMEKLTALAKNQRIYLSGIRNLRWACQYVGLRSAWCGIQEQRQKMPGEESLYRNPSTM